MAGHRRVRASVAARSCRLCAFIGSSFGCGSCRHHRGGPCHFVTIFGIWVVRVRRIAYGRGCAWSASSAIGDSVCWWASKTREGEFAGACPAFPPRGCPARATHNASTARTRAHLAPPRLSRAAIARISPGTSNVLVAPHPEARRSNPVSSPVKNPVSNPPTRVTARLFRVVRWRSRRRKFCRYERRVGGLLTLC